MAVVESDLMQRLRPLRDDVRRLGVILGETIKRFEGESVYEAVETLRALFKKIHRLRLSGQAESEEMLALKEELRNHIESLSLKDSAAVSRLFSPISTLLISLSRIIA